MPTPTSTSERELRRHPRTRVTGPVTVGWTDAAGVARISRGRYLDASQSGVSVELRDPLPERAYVNFRCQGLDVAGTGSVRYCCRNKLTFTIGLEFTGGLVLRSQ